MTKLFSLGTFLIPTLFVSACAVSAQTAAPTRNYLRPTYEIEAYYQPPSFDLSYELIVGFPKNQCAEMEAKAVENHNAFYRAAKILSDTIEEDSPYIIIGEDLFIKSYGCHPDLMTPGQNVVVIGLATKEEIEKEKNAEYRTIAMSHTYAFFDEKGNIVRWGRSW